MPFSGVNLPASEPDPYEMSIDDNLSYPQVPSKASAGIKEHMSRLAARLKQKGLPSTSYRGGQVIQVVIPCSLLFAPNEDKLMPGASKLLQPLVEVAGQEALYKIVLSVHADDTGDDVYANDLTERRAVAVDDFFNETLGDECCVIVPYGMGKADAITDNSSIANRARNRRLEVFIIPETALIEAAKN
ncbi:MAG: OmpA family protein [Muribaculaceae bacterium]|nr:OmpA family protein [Muribaculaceae bacterium]